MFEAVRGSNLSLDPALKELAICGVAVLNGAEYEWVHHAPPFLKAGGSQQQLDALRQLLVSSEAPPYPSSDPEIFSELERDAIQLTVEMTRGISPSPELMRKLREALGHQALVELTGSIAAYNMVSRFLVAMNITTEGE